MPTLRNILHWQASILLVGMLACSCGQNKGRYEIDSLIEDYAEEEHIQNNSDYVDADNLDKSLTEDKGSKNDEGKRDSASSDDDSENSNSAIPATRIRVRNLGRLAEVFNDSNYRQLAFAQALGIEPIKTLGDAYHARRPIIKVETNKDFTVDELTHSLPYLVPEASRLLSSIGRNFQDSLKKKGGGRYKIIATSLLRTPVTVKKLRRVNVNATDSSTHQFGTTFDISYRRFDCLDESKPVSEGDLKNTLAEVLYDLREQGRCLVKFERKTGCFHVTATR